MAMLTIGDRVIVNAIMIQATGIIIDIHYESDPVYLVILDGDGITPAIEITGQFLECLP